MTKEEKHSKALFRKLQDVRDELNINNQNEVAIYWLICACISVMLNLNCEYDLRCAHKYMSHILEKRKFLSKKGKQA